MRVNRQPHVHGCHCCQCDRAISHALTRVPLSNGRSRQVVQLKALLERAEARAASSQEAPCYPAATTPTKQSQSAQHHASPAQLRDTPADHNSSTPQKYNSNAEMPPHPHEICDLDIQGAMQVSEDSPPGGGSGKHTEYAVRVKLWCGLAYSVSRRYNAFFALDQQLQKAFPRVMLPELPPRSLFLSSILDQMDSRCAALNRYVKVILTRLFLSRMCTSSLTFFGLQGLVRDPLVTSSVVQKFLELDSVQQVCNLIQPLIIPTHSCHFCSFDLMVLQILSVVDQASYEW